MTVVFDWLIPEEDYLPDMEAIVDEALQETAKFTLREYKKTTRTWKRKPRFVAQMDKKRHTVIVYTENEIYGYVDEGTRPHKITPKRAPLLRFQSKYVAKTSPRIIGSKRGGASGPWVSAKEVTHPGTKARDFSKIIGQKTRQYLTQRVEYKLRSRRPRR